MTGFIASCGRRQRGVALIQVLLVFAILVAIAVQLGFRQRLTIAGTQQLLEEGQGKAWLYSVESLAQMELVRDFGQPFDDDYWGEWSESFDLEPGEARFRLTPLQGRYNLNWLHPEADQPDALDQVQRLLASESQEEAWAQRLADWFDHTSGAEFEYRVVQPGYRPSFSPLVDESELRLLMPDIIPLSELEISNWGAFLPTHSAIDITRASENVIRSLHPFMGEPQWQALEQVRSDGLNDPQDWLQHPDMAEEAWIDEVSADWFTTESHYFRLDAEVSYQDHTFYLTSWIYRGLDGSMQVYQRHHMPVSGQAPDNTDAENP